MDAITEDSQATDTESDNSQLLLDVKHDEVPQDAPTFKNANANDQSLGKHDQSQSPSMPLPITVVATEGLVRDPEATPVARNAFPAASTSTVRSSVKNTSIASLRAKTCRAAAIGDLTALLALLHPEDHGASDDDLVDYPSSFALVNSPTLSGLTPLLEAAQHGHLPIVRHLIEEEGAVQDLEDTEGENAFLKASYRGHLDIMKYLAEGDNATSIESSDREGWTALHNAAGRGYLEIVMWLMERGASVDNQSRHGYTALMNASSKGQLPVVRFLLSRYAPYPFLRNAYRETAFDVAVATFELGIAGILAAYEEKVWTAQHPGTPYNPLSLHLTIPVILYQNQRLDLRWHTRARRVAASTVTSPTLQHTHATTFTSAALSQRDGHAPSELPPTFHGINGSGRYVPLRKEDISLPTLREPNNVPVANRPALRRISSSASAASSSRIAGSDGDPAWYWLSESFFVDLSSADIEPDQGWQYATSFQADQWSAEMPEQVRELLTGSSTPTEAIGKPHKWVRRRRWARIMRRRLDIPDWGFADRKNGKAPEERSTASEGKMSQLQESKALPNPERELSELQDYLQRAKYFAGSRVSKRTRTVKGEIAEKHEQDSNASESEDVDDTASVLSQLTTAEGMKSSSLDRGVARRVTARLQRAIVELNSGMEADTNEGRKGEAYDLLLIFQTRLRLLHSQYPSTAAEENDEDTFQYPGADDDDDDSASTSTSLRSTSIYSPSLLSSPSSPPFRRGSSFLTSPTALENQPSISQQLSSNPSFQFSTNEVPPSGPLAQTAALAHPTLRTEAIWEPDDAANSCRRCQRKFTFFVRKHHCRKCGLLVCAQCSSHNDYLVSAEVIQEPGQVDPWVAFGITDTGGFYRTCDVCHADLVAQPALNLAAGSTSSTVSVPLQIPVEQTADPTGSSPMQRSISDLSELGDCPVCGINLSEIGEKPEQEAHIQACLESGPTEVRQDSRYLVFTLPESSPLVGLDCLICFESYEVGSQIGRLSCLCHFHKTCISNWLSRGKQCPVHAR